MKSGGAGFRIWVEIGVAWASLGGHFGDMMRIYGGLMGSKNGNVKNRSVSLLLFDGPRGARGRQENEQPSEPGGFWGHFGVTLGSLCILWVHFGPLSV